MPGKLPEFEESTAIATLNKEKKQQREKREKKPGLTEKFTEGVKSVADNFKESRMAPKDETWWLDRAMSQNETLLEEIKESRRELQEERKQNAEFMMSMAETQKQLSEEMVRALGYERKWGWVNKILVPAILGGIGIGVLSMGARIGRIEAYALGQGSPVEAFPQTKGPKLLKSM